MRLCVPESDQYSDCARERSRKVRYDFSGPACTLTGIFMYRSADLRNAGSAGALGQFEIFRTAKAGTRNTSTPSTA